MKQQALLTTQAKLKLAIIFFFQFYLSVAIVGLLQNPRKVCDKKRESLKSWNAAVSRQMYSTYFAMLWKSSQSST